MQRLSIGCVLAVLATLSLTSVVLAGGWAITTLDPVPQAMQAGQTYRIGYTIRQHGVSPYTQATPLIRIGLAGQRLSFRGLPEGAPGHYVSEVTFPSQGDWAWVADQQPFEAQALGIIAIEPVAAPVVVALPLAAESSVSAQPAVAPAAQTPAAQTPAELILLGLVALAATCLAVALRQMKRVSDSATKPSLASIAPV